MTRAQVLRSKIARKFEDRGVKFDTPAHEAEAERMTIAHNDDKYLFIEDIYRHNGASENCQVEITVKLLIDGWKYQEIYNSGKITDKAGERAIKNRIEKALEKFMYSDPEPFNMKMLDSFYQ